MVERRLFLSAVMVSGRKSENTAAGCSQQHLGEKFLFLGRGRPVGEKEGPNAATNRANRPYCGSAGGKLEKKGEGECFVCQHRGKGL